jgi:hypothetical protein
MYACIYKYTHASNFLSTLVTSHQPIPGLSESLEILSSLTFTTVPYAGYSIIVLAQLPFALTHDNERSRANPTRPSIGNTGIFCNLSAILPQLPASGIISTSVCNCRDITVTSRTTAQPIPTVIHFSKRKHGGKRMRKEYRQR